MDIRYGREAIVGTIVIIAVAIFAAGTLWLGGGSVLKKGTLIPVRFKHVSGLKRASAVTISGVQEGKVERIDLQPDRNVLVWVRIPGGIELKKDASARIYAVGLAGDQAVELDPGRSDTLLAKRATIPGSLASGFGERAASLSERAETLMSRLNKSFITDSTAEDLRGAVREFRGTMVQAHKTLEGFGDASHGTTAELTRTMQSLQRLSARLDTTLANPSITSLLHHTDTLTGDLARMTRQLSVTSARLDTLLTGVNQGRGTIGKFATDSTLFYELRDLSAAMKGLVAELQKNPGKLGVTVKVF